MAAAADWQKLAGALHQAQNKCLEKLKHEIATFPLYPLTPERRGEGGSLLFALCLYEDWPVRKRPAAPLLSAGAVHAEPVDR